MAEAIFLASLATIVYVYLGYPLLLVAWRGFSRRAVRKRYQEPAVSVVIAMHNERTNGQARLWNFFELDYPREKLQVIVSLDAPDDGTDELVSEFAGRGVEIVKGTVRSGKAVAVNRALAIARGDIVIFADAGQLFESRAVRELAANFADESVGAVSGELILLDGNEEAGGGVGWYWRYEKRLRALESNIHSVPGATGAIYAIRRSLFTPMAPGTILDDVVIPMRIVLAGKRVIFDPSARAYESVKPNPEVEFERKKRTLAGNYQLFREMPAVLVPWRNPIFIQLVSHKLGRLLVPYCLVAVFVSNLFLAAGVYRVILVCQVMWHAAAICGWLVSRHDETRGGSYRAGVNKCSRSS